MQPLRLDLHTDPQAPAVVVVGPPSTPEAAAVRARVVAALAASGPRRGAHGRDLGGGVLNPLVLSYLAAINAFAATVQAAEAQRAHGDLILAQLAHVSMTAADGCACALARAVDAQRDRLTREEVLMVRAMEGVAADADGRAAALCDWLADAGGSAPPMCRATKGGAS